MPKINNTKVVGVEYVCTRIMLNNHPRLLTEKIVEFNRLVQANLDSTNITNYDDFELTISKAFFGKSSDDIVFIEEAGYIIYDNADSWIIKIPG